MPYPLNNVPTQDAYNDFATTCEFHPPTRSATVIVGNAAIFAQLMRVPPGMRGAAMQPEPEEFWITGVYTVDRDFDFAAIRFRSAVAGQPAQVSCRG